MLFDGKMRGLFSLLFGASLLVVADRVAASGGSVWRVQGPRLAWLLVMGCAHAPALIWSGDILVLYALVGAVALLFVAEPPPALRVGCGARLRPARRRGLFLTVALGGMASGDDAAAIRRAADGRTSADLIAPSRHPGRRRWRAAPTTYSPPISLNQLLLYGPETLGLMLLGMMLVRSGLLPAPGPRARRARSVRPRLPGGRRCSAMQRCWRSCGARTSLPVVTTAAVLAFDYPLQPAAHVAWAALLCGWASARSTGWRRAAGGGGARGVHQLCRHLAGDDERVLRAMAWTCSIA